MELKPYIKITPRFFAFAPFLWKPVAYTIYPFIFLPQDLYNNLASENPNPRYVALLIHEEVHYERQKRMGIVRYALKYVFLPDFRFREELTGVTAALKYLKDVRIPFDFDISKKLDSNHLFAWPLSKYFSVESLRELFQKV